MKDTISQEGLKLIYKPRNLPHLFDGDKSIFITFRLKFTLPKNVIEIYNQQRADWYSELHRMPEAEKANALNLKSAQFFAWFDELLDKSKEVPQILHRAELSQIIASALMYHDEDRYHMLAYCIMPNHVHTLIFPKQQGNGQIYPPSHILYTWKKYTAARINKTLSRSGNLWQKESYDRMVRDDTELYNIVNYITQNPVVAGLADDWKSWQGTYVCPEILNQSNIP